MNVYVRRTISSAAGRALSTATWTVTSSPARRPAGASASGDGGGERRRASPVPRDLAPAALLGDLLLLLVEVRALDGGHELLGLVARHVRLLLEVPVLAALLLVLAARLLVLLLVVLALLLLLVLLVLLVLVVLLLLVLLLLLFLGAPDAELVVPGGVRVARAAPQGVPERGSGLVVLLLAEERLALVEGGVGRQRAASFLARLLERRERLDAAPGLRLRRAEVVGARRVFRVERDLFLEVRQRLVGLLLVERLLAFLGGGTGGGEDFL